MEIIVRLDSEKLLEAMSLEYLKPEEVHVSEERREGQHPMLVLRLIDCSPA